MEDEQLTTTCLKENKHSLKKEPNDTITYPNRGTSSREANSQPQIHKVSTGHAYIYGQVRNVRIGLSLMTKMMIHQGNLLGAGVGVSKAFLTRMKLRYTKGLEAACKQRARTQG